MNIFVYSLAVSMLFINGITGKPHKEVSVRSDNTVLRSSIHVQDIPPTTSLVYPGTDGRLVYVADSLGNKIPDFSNAGYKGGGKRPNRLLLISTCLLVHLVLMLYLQRVLKQVTRSW